MAPVEAGLLATRDERRSRPPVYSASPSTGSMIVPGIKVSHYLIIELFSGGL